jgi:hypothetical protein
MYWWGLICDGLVVLLILVCSQAIEDGRACRADWKIIARAYERMGNALMKQEKIEEGSALLLSSAIFYICACLLYEENKN